MWRNTPTIVCGNNLSLIVSNSTVSSVGYSDLGAHGHEDEQIFPPKMIPTLKNIMSIFTGCAHSACVDDEGNLFSFGSNEFGQLGIGVDEDTLEFTHTPQKVNLPPCSQVSCGDYFTTCLTSQGDIYSFGYNSVGQLGLGNNENYNSPQKIESLKDVEFIECGAFYTFCKTLNNEIFCWGDNEKGQLGLGNYDNHSSPIQNTLLKEDSIDIRCGYSFTLILTMNQDVYSCGSNAYGQLGRKDEDSPNFQKIPELSKISRIECGAHYSMCIDSNDNFYSFGDNSFGQLGLGDATSRFNPVKHPSLANIIDVSKGGYHTFVKTSNNEIYAFGCNYEFVLGTKIKAEKVLFPIRVFEGNEDIWSSKIKSKAKSARSILPRPSQEEDNFPPIKKQKISQ